MTQLSCIRSLLPCVLMVTYLGVTWANILPYSEFQLGAHNSVPAVFEKFKTKYNKSYDSVGVAGDHESYRRHVFGQNLLLIDRHNRKYASGEKTYYLDVNEFADMTPAEFRNKYLTTMKQRRRQSTSGDEAPFGTPWTLPNEVNWVEKGFVTKVKNQGECGSCWAFSAVGALEALYHNLTGKLVSLSEQQLLDCSHKYGNEACNGGLMEYAFDYIKHSGGLETEHAYPYKARKHLFCHAHSKLRVAKISGYHAIPTTDEFRLQVAVATMGPVSVAIDASFEEFTYYKGGIFNERNCTGEEELLNHGVLVVGYGSEPNDYWLVKNSWGTSWGNEGYIKMSRNKMNQCGIATDAIYPRA